MASVTALKVAIVAAGLTSREVAASVGLSETHFSRVVKGLHTPPYETRLKIAAAVGRHPDELFPSQSHPFGSEEAAA